MRKWIAIVCGLGALFFHLPAAVAQVDSWTNSAGGNWEDASWSLGSLPGTNQTILFTNDGSKTLTIDSKTVTDAAPSLSVDSLLISSPNSNTTNRLLLDHSGLDTPLVIGDQNQADSFVITSNCAVEMYGASLSAGDVSIGGTFSESGSSELQTHFLNLGDIGPGVFNLTNSSVLTFTEVLGTNFPAVFNQQGGTNLSPLDLRAMGTYNLYDGAFGDGPSGYTEWIIFRGGNFHQFGGVAWANMLFYDPGMSEYQLSGGTLHTLDLTIGSDFGNGGVRQTGGTNLAHSILLTASSRGGTGKYILAGGTLVISSGFGMTATAPVSANANTEPEGSPAVIFEQSGGFCMVENYGVTIAPSYDIDTRYELSGGALATPAIYLDGSGVVEQSGGTNTVGTITTHTTSQYVLSGGWLNAQAIQLSGYDVPFGFLQTGGTNQVQGTLQMSDFPGYALSAGRLTAQSVVIYSSKFYDFGGTAEIQSLSLIDGTWIEQSSGQSLGQLKLVGNYPGSISYLILSNQPCVLKFGDSSSLSWSNSAVLTIQKWAGSIYGGGRQQIFFGSNSAALTPQQLSQIQFQDPAGVAAGDYPARILATGEIVPDTGAPLPMKLSIACSPTNGMMQLNVGAEIGQSYDIEVSTNLADWTWWTNEFNSNGTIYLNDFDATNYPQKYYRAHPAP